MRYAMLLVLLTACGSPTEGCTNKEQVITVTNELSRELLDIYRDNGWTCRTDGSARYVCTICE